MKTTYLLAVGGFMCIAIYHNHKKHKNITSTQLLGVF